jgi:UTP--glucose-1-phosphate uridylyltransferase
LDSDLAGLDPALVKQLAAAGFDPQRLRGWAGRLLHAGPDVNRVAGEVSPPAPGDVTDLPDRESVEGTRLAALGEASLARGELALVVLAGGMATRMGGVVKALVDALPGTTFLDARLAEQLYWQRTAGAELPMWLMTSHATDEAVREALGDRIDGDRVAVFSQQASLRLDP